MHHPPRRLRVQVVLQDRRPPESRRRPFAPDVLTGVPRRWRGVLGRGGIPGAEALGIFQDFSELLGAQVLH